jgi:hypothetical protein
MPIKPSRKTPMPMLDPVERRRLFQEVNQGYGTPAPGSRARLPQCQTRL